MQDRLHPKQTQFEKSDWLRGKGPRRITVAGPWSRGCFKASASSSAIGAGRPSRTRRSYPGSVRRPTCIPSWSRKSPATDRRHRPPSRHLHHADSTADV